MMGRFGGMRLVIQATGMPIGLLGGNEAVQPDFRHNGLVLRIKLNLPFLPGGSHTVQVESLKLCVAANGHGNAP
jgi:hypothetical protein